MKTKTMPDAKKAPSRKTGTRPALTVTVDFPREREFVLAGDYAVRISAPPEAEVEAAVDGGGWMKCRSSSGFHWLDWKPGSPGIHQLSARARGERRPWVRSPERSCIVVAAKEG
jgi:hypothetical protein